MALFWLQSVNSVTKTTPYEAVFGRDIFKEQRLGLRLDQTRFPLVQDASLRKQVEELRRHMDAITRHMQKQVEIAKMKTYLRDNRTRKEHNFAVDDIVFIKDHRLPTSGTNPKFRPALQPSPFVVSKISDHLAEVVRVVDRFTTKVNPDDLLKVPLETPSLYDGLADEVLVELGKGLTDEVMEQLARLDNFCLLYTSPSPRDKRQSRMPSSA